jgi:hypothetical protein
MLLYSAYLSSRKNGKNFEKKKPKREKIEVKTNQQKNCVTFYFILF